MLTHMRSPRGVRSLAAAGLAVAGVALAAGLWLALFGIAASHSPAIFSLVAPAGPEIWLEVNRSPICPSGLVSMCGQSGTGPLYFSAWLYTWPTPNSRTAQVLVAFPVGP